MTTRVGITGIGMITPLGNDVATTWEAICQGRSGAGPIRRFDPSCHAVRIAAERDVVSALFVIPYPPGFPILVPGQVISAEILKFMAALDVREIHGFRPELGFRIFNDAALRRVAEATAARAALAVSGRAATPTETPAGAATPADSEATPARLTRSES